MSSDALEMLLVGACTLAGFARQCDCAADVSVREEPSAAVDAAVIEAVVEFVLVYERDRCAHRTGSTARA